MKRFFSMMAIIGLIAASNCSRIPENNDPVLGAWVKIDPNDGDTTNTARINDAAISEEWIFNDVYMGRYHNYSGNEIVFYTDFRWEIVDGTYTISYSRDQMSEVRFSLTQSQGNERLELENGDVFAIRRQGSVEVP